jgi:hypothetical protein
MCWCVHLSSMFFNNIYFFKITKQSLDQLENNKKIYKKRWKTPLEASLYIYIYIIYFKGNFITLLFLKKLKKHKHLWNQVFFLWQFYHFTSLFLKNKKNKKVLLYKFNNFLLLKASMKFYFANNIEKIKKLFDWSYTIFFASKNNKVNLLHKKICEPICLLSIL